jgi:hypothetical protein
LQPSPFLGPIFFSIGIMNTEGDVFGTGISGSANIIGKEVGYRLYCTRKCDKSSD